ncbi:MAG: cell division protease FtsH [Actinomycetota bacterium]|jgi:cell division protease FtsH|nr:cell division protease FtsH [Actinomycetota bacterium]
MAKIPSLFQKEGEPANKPGGDGANGSPTGPNQPGGSAAGQPAPFLQNRRNQIVAALLLLGVLLILPIFGMGQSATNEKQLSDVLAALPSGQFSGHQITKATLDDDNRVLQLTLDNANEIQTSYPNQFGTELVKDLQDAKIPFDTQPVHHASPIGGILAMLLPVAMIIAFFVWMSKKGAMGMGGATNAKAFTATKAELPEPPSARFTDVVGCDEAVEELSEIVSFLHDPTHFDAAGAKMPRGFLLVGPPGTGKTLLARAVAGEAGVPFYSAAGSDFSEMFVGVGAARVRDLFAKAKKTGGIVFLDEIDSVGRARNGNAPGGGANDERESTLNALLVEMDGFSKETNVVIVAATNRPDILDPALTRAGRFDRQVTVAPPDRRGRTRLLDLYSKDRSMGPDVDFVALARRTPGLTGADICNLVNQAALEAARGRRGVIHASDFDEALATVMMGRARKSAVVTDMDRKVTAWHEAGHTVAALVLPDANDPVQVTIVPRGPAGGVTWMGGDDNSFLTRTQARAQLVVALGGRAAEELLLDGDFTQGASGDLQSATGLATQMVTKWGMSDMGLVAMDTDRIVFGGIGDKVHAEIDSMLNRALESARTLLAEHRALFDAVVSELLDEDTVDLDRLQAIWTEIQQPSLVA